MSYPALENFCTRVKRLNASGSKELRVTKEEANGLLLELTELLLKKPRDKIVISRPNTGPTQVDGGTF